MTLILYKTHGIRKLRQSNTHVRMSLRNNSGRYQIISLVKYSCKAHGIKKTQTIEHARRHESKKQLRSLPNYLVCEIFIGIFLKVQSSSVRTIYLSCKIFTRIFSKTQGQLKSIMNYLCCRIFSKAQGITRLVINHLSYKIFIRYLFFLRLNIKTHHQLRSMGKRKKKKISILT